MEKHCSKTVRSWGAPLGNSLMLLTPLLGGSVLRQKRLLLCEAGRREWPQDSILNVNLPSPPHLSSPSEKRNWQPWRSLGGEGIPGPQFSMEAVPWRMTPCACPPGSLWRMRVRTRTCTRARARTHTHTCARILTDLHSLLTNPLPLHTHSRGYILGCLPAPPSFLGLAFT